MKIHKKRSEQTFNITLNTKILAYIIWIKSSMFIIAIAKYFKKSNELMLFCVCVCAWTSEGECASALKNVRIAHFGNYWNPV